MPDRGSSPLIRSFAADEWQLYRDLRLRALQDSPDAFSSTYAREAPRPDVEWAERLARGVRSPRDLPLVAELAGEPCGLAWGRIEDSPPATARVYQMWVAPTHRRRGVGRALLDAVIGWARTEGARIVELDVTTTNRDALRLYERGGFKPLGETSPLRPGSHLQVQTMQLSLMDLGDE